MKTIELLGLPNVGKSLLFKNIKKIFKKNHNYESIFYFWLLKNKKINYLTYKLIIYLIFNNITDYKKNKYLFFFQRKIYFFLRTKLSYQFSIHQNRIKRKYNLFFKALNKFLKGHKDTNRLSKLFIGILLGYELAKTMKTDLISSEGLAQRLLSVSLRKKISKSNLRVLSNYLPKPSHIIYLVKDNQTDTSVDEIVKVYHSKKVKIIFLKTHHKKYHKIIFELSKIIK